MTVDLEDDAAFYRLLNLPSADFKSSASVFEELEDLLEKYPNLLTCARHGVTGRAGLCCIWLSELIVHLKFCNLSSSSGMNLSMLSRDMVKRWHCTMLGFITSRVFIWFNHWYYKLGLMPFMRKMNVMAGYHCSMLVVMVLHTVDQLK